MQKKFLTHTITTIKIFLRLFTLVYVRYPAGQTGHRKFVANKSAPSYNWQVT